MNICKCCGQSIDESKWLKIPELKIEVEIEVHDKGKSYKDLNLDSKEEQLLTAEQCIFIINNEKYSKLLKMDGSSGKDDFFIKQYSPLSKKNNYVAQFYAVSDYSDLWAYCGSSVSSSALGVRYVRPLKVKKRK